VSVARVSRDKELSNATMVQWQDRGLFICVSLYADSRG
jgi:hypothetical protein